MGSLNVRLAKNREDLNQFTKCLLTDIHAFERMLEEEWFEDGDIKIGAEQEICLVDDHGKPAPVALEVLKKLAKQSDNFTSELALFNIEANLDPLPFTGTCFSDLEKDILRLTGMLDGVLKDMDVNHILTGILPSIRKFDLVMENLTPYERYYALMEALQGLRGGANYELKLEGIDELNVLHDSAIVEACNTSFQVHLQTKPNEFISKYNVAQAISAPVLALASNSPMLFGKRLWSETRIALFRQSIDTRLASEHMRERSPRVTLGNSWLQGSILNLFKEDIMRFRVLLTTDAKADALKKVEQGIVPSLDALNVHNSTVYRWNRPCFGMSQDKKPHLRIENRLLPSGPSVVDEVANSAFWIGLMNGFEDQYKDVTKVMDFDDAKSNFLRAARNGLGVDFTWMNGKKISDIELIKKELLPMAKHGLSKAGVNKDDISKYLDIIEERNETRQTGTNWLLNSYSKLIKDYGKEEVTTALTLGTINKQKHNIPVSQWDLATVDEIQNWEPSEMLVEEFMTTDVITVSPDDIPEFAADILNWQRIRYLPVEDKDGKLCGLISSRMLLSHFANVNQDKKRKKLVVKDLMLKDIIVVSPSETINEAMQLMSKKEIGCLPVELNGNLIGIITEANFIHITASLLNRIAKKRKQRKKERGSEK
jgi:CBS domain-containing protein/gamma-glutamylcysteine synthetase